MAVTVAPTGPNLPKYDDVDIIQALQDAAASLYDNMRFASKDADRIAAAKALGDLMLEWDDHLLLREDMRTFAVKAP